MKPSPQLLPAAAAFTVAGFLLGGAGAAIHFSPASSGSDLAIEYDPADLPPPDRGAQTDRASRTDPRADAPGGGDLTAHGIAGTLQPRQAVAAVTETVLATGACQASFYEYGDVTASGEAFSPDELTAANRDLPFDSLVRVTNAANGQSVVVRINDRGPFYGSDRCLDLTKGAFASIANVGDGVVDVRYEVLAQDAT